MNYDKIKAAAESCREGMSAFLEKRKEKHFQNK